MTAQDTQEYTVIQDEWDGNVKYFVEFNDEFITASLLQGDYDNEMEIRIGKNNERYSVRGHKSIMDKMSFDDFIRKVKLHIERQELFKKIKEERKKEKRKN